MQVQTDNQLVIFVLGKVSSKTPNHDIQWHHHHQDPPTTINILGAIVDQKPKWTNHISSFWFVPFTTGWVYCDKWSSSRFHKPFTIYTATRNIEECLISGILYLTGWLQLPLHSGSSTIQSIWLGSLPPPAHCGWCSWYQQNALKYLPQLPQLHHSNP